jgi:ABC-type nitrate/sulfonate/bicarbonate transport system substrate-binding protein
MEPVRVALDWTPNTSHAALLVAHAKGFFGDEGLAVSFVSPTDEGAPDTPLEGVVGPYGISLGVAPCDDVLAEAMGLDRVVAIATLLQRDISALCVVVPSSSASTHDASSADACRPAASRPGLLAGARYASCGYPLEKAAIDAMVIGDGGGAGVLQVCPPMRTETEMLLIEGHVDCAWMYRPWEVLRAARRGVKLHEMVPGEWGVPFGYMNTLVAPRSQVEQQVAEGAGWLARFLRAVVKGGVSVVEDPRDAAQLLARGGYGAELGDVEFNHESLCLMVSLGVFDPPCEDNGTPWDCSMWARMEERRWEAFFGWVESIAGMGGAEATAADGSVDSDRLGVALQVGSVFKNRSSASLPPPHRVFDNRLLDLLEADRKRGGAGRDNAAAARD